ncbi:MAG: oxidoreductase, partial [Chitinophagaceae bacterium]
MKKILAIISLFFGMNAGAQTVKIVSSGTKTGMRGLSVVDDKTIWVSGSGGKIGRSLDGGENWKWFTVKGFEKMDFRDIEGFNATTAVIMGIDAPAYILKTIDGGE